MQVRDPSEERLSVNKFDLGAIRAHNPHENPFGQKVYSRYEPSPQKWTLVAPQFQCFLEKIHGRQYLGVLENKNEAKGFDRYVSDCSAHMQTAITLKKTQQERKIVPPIPIIIPPNAKSKNLI